MLKAACHVTHVHVHVVHSASYMYESWYKSWYAIGVPGELVNYMRPTVHRSSNNDHKDTPRSAASASRTATSAATPPGSEFFLTVRYTAIRFDSTHTRAARRAAAMSSAVALALAVVPCTAASVNSFNIALRKVASFFTDVATSVFRICSA